MSEYTYEQGVAWVRGLTDTLLDAEIEQAHATAHDSTLSDHKRRCAMAACILMCEEKSKRQNL